MSILVIAEHDHTTLKAATLNTVAAAQKIGGEVHLLVAGANCNAAAQDAATLSGVTVVKVADAAHYQNQTAENLTALVIANAAGYSHILAPATTFGKNLMPRVAALLDVAQISEITGVESADTFVRPIYAGNALATVKSADTVKVITVRTTAFDAVNRENAAKIENISPAATPCSNRSPTSSVQRWAPPVPPSMPALCPMTIRSVRPARSSPRSFTSPSVFPAPSSTLPG